MSIKFSSIWPIDRTLSSATTPGQGEPGSDGNEGALCISKSSNITGTSSPDCLVSYPGHSLGGEVVSLCRYAVGVFYSPSRQGLFWLRRKTSFTDSVNGIAYFLWQQIPDISSQWATIDFCLNDFFLADEVIPIVNET